MEVIKILVIADVPNNLKELKDIIQKTFRAAIILTSSNGSDGIELALEESPNMIFLDTVMAGMDGFEVARRVKADDRLKHIPLIFLTAPQMEKKSRIKALETGAEAFLTKPFDEPELIAQVRAMLKIHASAVKGKREMAELTRSVEERTREMEKELIQRRNAEQDTQAAYTKLKQNQAALLNLMEEMKDEISARQKAEDGLKQHLTELEILAEFSQALGQLMTPQQIGQKIVDLFEKALNWKYVAIRRYNPENDTLSVLAFNQPGIENEKIRKETMDRYNDLIRKPEDGLSGWAWKTRQLVRLADVNQDSHYKDIVPEIRSGLYVPIMVGEHSIGVISLESDEWGFFSEADERLVTTLAAQAGIALENARLFEQTMTRLKNIESLRQIDRAISSNFDMKSTLAIIAETAQSQLKVSAVDILLFNQHSQMLSYVYGQGFRSSKVRGVHLNMKNSLAGEVVKGLKMVQIVDLKGANSASQPENFESEGFVSYIGVPLMAKGKVNGVLEVFDRTWGKRDREWIDFLEAFAHQAAIAIDNSGLFENLQRLNVEIASAYDATIETWAQTLEIRDKAFLGHARRVMKMSVKIASAMGLSGEAISQVRHGVMMHDIGMLGIPEHILLKPGKLTASEWETVRQHPRIAYDLLSQLPKWRQALVIPYSHHEKWDGSGYPQGLKNDIIPLGARICAVTDVYDTLQMERSYRPAWDKTRAAQYIREAAGSHFDPEVVRVFFAMIKD